MKASIRRMGRLQPLHRGVGRGPARRRAALHGRPRRDRGAGRLGHPRPRIGCASGAAVDEFKYMVYDYRDGASEAGPSPLAWRAVLTFAATQLWPKNLFGRSGLRLPVDRQPGRKPNLATGRQADRAVRPILQRDRRQSLVHPGHRPDHLSRRRIHAGTAQIRAHRPPRSGGDFDLVPGRGRSGYLADHSTRNALTNLPISKSPNLWEI